MVAQFVNFCVTVLRNRTFPHCPNFPVLYIWSQSGRSSLLSSQDFYQLLEGGRLLDILTGCLQDHRIWIERQRIAGCLFDTILIEKQMGSE